MPERMSEYMAERMSGSMWRAQSKMSEGKCQIHSRWYIRNYFRIVLQGGDRSKKAILASCVWGARHFDTWPYTCCADCVGISLFVCLDLQLFVRIHAMVRTMATLGVVHNLPLQSVYRSSCWEQLPSEYRSLAKVQSSATTLWRESLLLKGAWI